MPKKAIIIGAGPAGLTAAYELLKRTDIVPVILEKSGEIGGISRTTDYKGNRMDMGPHRFFSKSDRVMEWWLDMMPLDEHAAGDATISYQNKSRTLNSKEPSKNQGDKVMLVIQRLTRIYFLRKFFAYPIQLSLDTLKTLGLFRTLKIVAYFLWIRAFPRKPEKNLEDFIINKFGKELYLLFFKDYTEKVWGIPPSQISAEWGAQRIKGLSLGKAISSAVKSLRAKRQDGIAQKGTETSLIEQFLYPKYGPGSLWEEVARRVVDMGGKIYLHQDVQRIYTEDGKVQSINTIHSQTGQAGAWEGDYFFSTMPVQELIAGMGDRAPEEVRRVAAGLQYRDFINVGILLKQMAQPLKDNWIYIQERDVKVGRLMIYNNWGGGMVKDPNTTWIGMEYFCNKTDAFWAEPDRAIEARAIAELVKMDLARAEDVLDSTVRRMEKTYPAYFGTYAEFEKIRLFTDTLENLFLVGRNGMHKYNNADHSMLTAMVSVDNIAAGITSKANIWAINTEQEYHEEKSAAKQTVKEPVPEPASFGSFKEYLAGNRWVRRALLFSGLAMLLQFIVFKFLYPFAGFINADSYIYLQSATWNNTINIYPVGYSWFLRFISLFSTSDTFFVAIQYLLLEGASLFLLLTIFYLYHTRAVTRSLLMAFVVINPLFLYVANYISSDAYFTALSITWFTLLLWIMQKPTLRLVLVQSVVLFLAFATRYNALYYPVIGALAFLLTKQPLYRKALHLGLSVLLAVLFMWNTSSHYLRVSGTRQFSPFSGWQIANNALYAYRYIDSEDVKPVPARFQALDKVVRHYFDTSRDYIRHPTELLLANTFYMWDSISPLQKYMYQQMPKVAKENGLKSWAVEGPLYGAYGTYLIKTYPKTYLQYYIIPNAFKCYAPPLEFLESYNMGRDTVAAIAKEWFRFKTNKVRTAFKDNHIGALDPYPIAIGSLNMIFAVTLLFFAALKNLRRDHQLNKLLLVGGCAWLVNFGFSVLASPVGLRYQVFPFVVTFCLTGILIEHIYAASKDAAQAAKYPLRAPYKTA